MAQVNRALLGGGENLIEAAAKKLHGFPKPLPRTYAEARLRFLERLDPLAAELALLPPEMKLPGGTIVAVRLHPDFTGAVHEPDRLLAYLPAAVKVGARGWRVPLAEVAPTAAVRRDLDHGVAEAMARLVFLAVDEIAFLAELRDVLARPEAMLPQAARHDLQRIERIGLLAPEEQISPAAFPSAWTGGRVELVLHPSPLAPERQRAHLLARLEGAGIAAEAVRFRPYPGLPSFVSLPLARAALDRLRGYNPLRTAGMLDLNPLPVLRAGPMLAAPQPPPPGPVASVKVAVFDGGFDDRLPLLGTHALLSPSSSSRVPPHPDCVAHGTAVAGAILHGPLNAYPARAVLPAPPVSVVGFRVFPLSDPDDLDLYEAIDAIERAVPHLDGVRVVNLSFGPRGPISDDNISRFTYVLDRLAYERDLLPVVAVGNDGSLPGCGRVQAPADAVNALSVGAFSQYDRERYAVGYSCRGPGREGAKGKPDLVAFGGCERTPFHLVSARPGMRVLDHGTSFAAPLVTRRCAELLGRCPDLSPLLLRALLIHHSRHPGAGFDYSLGHGFCPENIDEMVGCPPKTVSVLLTTPSRRRGWRGSRCRSRPASPCRERSRSRGRWSCSPRSTRSHRSSTPRPRWRRRSIPTAGSSPSPRRRSSSRAPRRAGSTSSSRRRRRPRWPPRSGPARSCPFPARPTPIAVRRTCAGPT